MTNVLLFLQQHRAALVLLLLLFVAGVWTGVRLAAAYTRAADRRAARARLAAYTARAARAPVGLRRTPAQLAGEIDRDLTAVLARIDARATVPRPALPATLGAPDDN
jgi:hypothetical protein